MKRALCLFCGSWYWSLTLQPDLPIVGNCSSSLCRMETLVADLTHEKATIALGAIGALT